MVGFRHPTSRVSIRSGGKKGDRASRRRVPRRTGSGVRPLDASLNHWAREIPHANLGLAVASGLLRVGSWKGEEERADIAGLPNARHWAADRHWGGPSHGDASSREV